MQETYRMRILKLINSEDRVFSGKEIARICDLSYKQTIDALDGLHNYEWYSASEGNIAPNGAALNSQKFRRLI